MIACSRNQAEFAPKRPRGITLAVDSFRSYKGALSERNSFAGRGGVPRPRTSTVARARIEFENGDKIPHGSQGRRGIALRRCRASLR